MSFSINVSTEHSKHHDQHPKCEGYRDDMTGEYDCGYDTKIICEDCKYGCGKKDPEAACNQQ